MNTYTVINKIENDFKFEVMEAKDLGSLYKEILALYPTGTIISITKVK